MTVVEDGVLWAHIATGFLALFAGLGALVTQKGGRRHRRLGRTYLYAMAVVSGTSLALYALSPAYFRFFLALVAVFSFYFAFSGYRVLARKRPHDEPTSLDWGAVGVFVVASLGLVTMGAQLYLRGSDFAVVILVFGGIGTVFGVSDVRKFRSRRNPGAWVSEHVTRMGAGYIATVSAFSAVNFAFLPVVLRWLWPTLLGTPLLLYLKRQYQPGDGNTKQTSDTSTARS